MYIGLAIIVYAHRIWPHICWFHCQYYRIYTVYLYIYMVLANPTCMQTAIGMYKRVCKVPEYTNVYATWVYFYFYRYGWFVYKAVYTRQWYPVAKHDKLFELYNWIYKVLLQCVCMCVCVCVCVIRWKCPTEAFTVVAVRESWMSSSFCCVVCSSPCFITVLFN